MNTEQFEQAVRKRLYQLSRSSKLKQKINEELKDVHTKEEAKKFILKNAVKNTMKEVKEHNESIRKGKT